MYPGQNLNRDLLETKLDHLGYRRVSYAPKKKGEMRLSPSALEIYLNDFMAPHGNRKAFPVRISLVKNAIDSIVNLETGDQVSLLELEPEELMLFFGPDREQRKLISISQVPRHVSHAVLAAEDAHFYEHHGVDPWGILRALYQNLRHGDIRQGGSTITQQLAKNYFLTPERSISRKFKEVLMALTMEWIYEKDVILEIYLNEIYLGQNGSVSVNGIGEASLFYFNKQVSELSLNEGATIAAIIRAPGVYSPYVDKERCQHRRDWVLGRMLKQGWISEEELLIVQAQPLQTSGFENYAKKAPYFLDYLAQQLKALYPEEVLTSLGLSIFTTLDTQVQMAAEKALQRGLARIEKASPSLKRAEPEKKLQGAVIVMQPKTGYLLAMVGGRNYNESQFNRATQAKRQPAAPSSPSFSSVVGQV
jgi:penicillin-binding protein 1B